MKALTQITLVVILLGVASPSRAAGSFGQAADFERDAKALCDYDAMAGELRLTAEQVTKIELILKRMEAALAEWDRANAARLASLGRDQDDARRAGETSRLCQTLNQFMELATRRRALAEPYRKLIWDVLTEQQQAKWQGFLLARKLTERYKRLDPTADQKTQIRALCDASGSQLAELHKKDDRRQIADVERQVNTRVIETVFTEAQRASLTGRSDYSSSSDDKIGADVKETYRPGADKADDKAKGKNGGQGDHKSVGGKNDSDARRKKELEARKRADDARRKKEAAQRKREQEDRRRRNNNNNRRRRDSLRRRAAEQNKNSSNNNNKPKPKPKPKPSGKNTTGTPRPVKPTSHNYRPA